MADERTTGLYKTVLVFISILLMILFVYTIRDILIIFSLAFLLGYALNGPITWLQKRGVPRWVTLIFVLITLISLITLAFSILIPNVIEQIQSFAKNLPQYQKTVVKFWQKLVATYPSIQEEIDFDALLSQLQQRLSQAITPIFTAVSSLFTFFIGLIAVIVISFFGLTNPEGLKKAAIQLIPPAHNDTIMTVSHRISEKIGNYLKGVLLAGLIIGLASYFGFTLLGIEYALTLGIIAGILEMVPLVGPIISGSIAVSVAFFQEPVLAVYTLIFAIGLQQMENHLLIPKLMSRQVGLHPVTIIFTTLVMAKLLGIVGFFLAVPIASAIKIFIEEIYLPNIGEQT